MEQLRHLWVAQEADEIRGRLLAGGDLDHIG
jgi:hypothetical protein